MSEGTMDRTAPRRTRILALAAIPVMLVASCSSDPDPDAKSPNGAASGPAKTGSSPSVAAAEFSELPRPCEAISRTTVTKLVPKTKNERGTEGRSADTTAHGTCSWHGLNGYQYRWLHVSLQRFDSDPTLGSGEQRAKDYYTKQVQAAKTAQGTRNLVSGTAAGLGDTATTVRYDVTKDGDGYRNQTVVARAGNAVVTVNYNGAGFEGEKAPKAEDMLKQAEGAAKEAVNAVTDANE